MILSHLPSTLFIFFFFQLLKLFPPLTPLLALFFLSHHHLFFASFSHVQCSCLIFLYTLKFCAHSFFFHCSIDVDMFKLIAITTFKLLALFAFLANFFFCCFISCCLEVAWEFIVDFFFWNFKFWSSRILLFFLSFCQLSYSFLQASYFCLRFFF